MSSTPPPKGKGCSLWLILGVPSGFLLILTLAPALVYWIWSSGHAREVEKLTAEIAAKGEPLTSRALVDDFELEADQENVAALWIEAMTPLSTREFGESCKALPFVGYEWDGDPPRTDEPWEGLEEAEAFLKEHRLTFEKIDQAVARGGHARFPMDFERGIHMEMPNVQYARNIARMLQLQFEVQSRRGDVEGAAKTLHALFTLSRCCQAEPVIVAQLVAIAMDGCAKQALADKLGWLAFDGAFLLDVQRRLRAEDPANRMKKGLLGERAMIFVGMQDMSRIKDTLPARSAMSSDVHCYLRYMARLVDSINLTFPDALRERDQIEKELKAELSGVDAMVTKTLTMMLLPATGAVFEAVAKDMTTTRAADAGIAAELHRRETGELPKTLEDLVPKYLPAVPTDPFDGSPMRYKSDETGFTIYSVGKNGADDGGSLDKAQSDVGLFFPTLTRKTE